MTTAARALVRRLSGCVLALLSACETIEKGGASERDATSAPLDAGSEPDASPSDQPALRGEDFLLFESRANAEGQTVEVSFDVPADAHAFVTTIQAHAARPLLLTSLEGPGGQVLFAAADQESALVKPPSTRNLSPDFPLSVLVPTRALGLSEGRYRARFYAGNLREGDVDERISVDVVFQRRAPADTLATRLWVAQGSARDARAMREDQTLLAAFAVMREIFKAAQISLSELNIADLISPLPTPGGSVDSAQIAAWITHLPAADRGIDLLLVDEIAAPDGATLVGKTIGIPGPPAHPALSRRGAVVLSLSALPTDAERMGEILAHEAAHYLGLAHTTEMDGSHDALRDTPECPSENASFRTSSGDTVLSAEDCWDFDGQNLMFWLPRRNTKGAQRVLTTSQAQSMRDHPALE